MECDFGFEDWDPRDGDNMIGKIHEKTQEHFPYFTNEAADFRTRSDIEAEEQDSSHKQTSNDEDSCEASEVYQEPALDQTYTTYNKRARNDETYKRGQRGGKKSKRKRLGSAQTFYQTVLGWTIEGLLCGTRKGVDLPPLGKVPDTFRDRSHYYGAIGAVALEEARAALSQGVLQSKRARPGEDIFMQVQIRKVWEGDEAFATDPEALPMLELEACNEPSTLSFKTLRPGAMLWLIRHKADDGSALTRRGCRSPVQKTVVASAEGFLAALAHGAQAAKVEAKVRVFSNRTLVWVGEGAMASMREQMRAPLEGSRWTVRLLPALISQQRMVAACALEPRPPFLHHLLGAPPAKHTKFDSDDDEDDGDDKVEEEGSDDRDEGEDKGGAEVVASEVNGGHPDGVQHRGLEPVAGAVHGVRASVGCELNESQRAARDKFLAAEEGQLHLVQGPPGCGKTVALVAALHGLCAQGKRVLVCAPSNKAVCVALERFLATGGGIQPPCALVGVEDKLMQIGGADQDQSNQSRAPTLCPGDVFVYQLTARMALRLQQAADEILGTVPVSCIPDGSSDSCGRRHDASVMQGDAACVADEARSFCTSGDAQFLVRVSHTSSCRAAASQVLQAALRGVAATRAILAQLQASAPSFLRAHVRGTIDAVLEAMNDIADAVTDTPDDKHQINPEECGDKGGDGGSPPRANWPCGRERRTCRRARRLQLCVRAARRSLELGGAQGPEMEAVAREALANAGCIFTTLSSAGQQLVRSSVPVDVLVVDEAAQALEAEVAIAFSLRPKKCLLVGDPMQLPATLLSVESQRNGSGRSLMQRLMQGCAYPYSFLDTQHRMHAAIAKFPCAQFYEGKLINARETLDRAPPWTTRLHRGRAPPPCFMAPYSFIDVAAGDDSQASASRSTQSISNPHEARMVAALLLHWQNDFGLDLRRDACVITFYSAQVSCIRRALRQTGVAGEVRVHTVDSFQGSEAAVCVCSFVRSNRSARVGFVKDFQRLNVALTRAQHALISVGHALTLEKSDSQDLKLMIQNARQRGVLFSALEIEKELHIMLGNGSVSASNPSPELCTMEFKQ